MSPLSQVNACFERAGEAIRGGNIDVAGAIFTQLLARSEPLPADQLQSAKLGLARIKRWKDEFNASDLLYRDVLSKNSEVAEAHVGLGIIAMELLEFAEAAARLDIAKKLDASNEELQAAMRWLDSKSRIRVSVSSRSQSLAGLSTHASNSTVHIDVTREFAANFGVTNRSDQSASLGQAELLTTSGTTFESGVVWRPTRRDSAALNLAVGSEAPSPSNGRYRSAQILWSRQFEAATHEVMISNTTFDAKRSVGGLWSLSLPVQTHMGSVNLRTVLRYTETEDESVLTGLIGAERQLSAAMVANLESQVIRVRALATNRPLAYRISGGIRVALAPRTSIKIDGAWSAQLSERTLGLTLEHGWK